MRKIYKRLTSGLLVAVLLTMAASAQDKAYQEYRPLIVKNAFQLGISKADATDAIITHAYTDATTNITFVYLQQAYQQIKVYKTIITVTFRDGSLLYHSGTFVDNIAEKAGTAVPLKSYTEAVQAAAQHLQLPVPESFATVANVFAAQKKYTVSPAGIAKKNIDVTLYWVPSADIQQVALSWNVNIDELRSADWWNVRINAITGEFVEKDNWTVNEHLEELLPKSITSVPAGLVANLPINETAKKRSPTSKTVANPPLVLQAPRQM